MSIRIEVSPGELIDKITILEIKLDHIRDPEKLDNIRHEHSLLTAVLGREVPQSAIVAECATALKVVNGELWRIEDEIRDCERAQDFGPKFIALARSVYRANDRRASLKREINMLLQSEIVEEKSYAAY